MAKSPTLARAIENYLRGTTMAAAPTTGWLGLLDAGGTELAYPGYARQSVDMDTVMWGANGGILSNQATIPFPGPTSGGPHNQAVKGRIYKASTGTDYWFDGLLVEPKTPVNGQDFVVPVGGITHTENPAP